MKFLHGVVGVSLLGTALYAAPRSLEEIRNVAVNFAAEHSQGIEKWSVASEARTPASSQTVGEKPAYHILRLNPSGWIIISDDDIARPVLAYNLEENNTGPLPENFQSWMDGVSKQINEAKSIYKTSPFQEEWNRLAVNPKSFKAQNKILENDSSVQGVLRGPLLDITWDQGTYYNTKCPEDADGPDGHVWAGCVATAMVQIMKYHNWPNKGKGNHSYDSNYGTLSANFGTTSYQWKSMPSQGKVTNYNNAVATIMYHAGVSVDMNYGPDGSGAHVSDADHAFRTYFKYATSGVAYRSNMSENDWHDLLQREINARRPVFYAGYGSGGHAFVCDGYDNRDASNVTYHFNWGWSGYYNGYYALGDLTPGSHDYSDDNTVIYGIRPVGKIKIKAPTNLRATNITKHSVILHWKDRSKNEKGFKIYQNGQLVKRVKANVKRAKIKNLVSGTRYLFKVRAYKGVDESPAAKVRVKTHGKKPAIPPIRIGQSVSDKLTEKSLSTHREGSYAKYYLLKISRQTTVQIDEMSEDFDSYLFLLDGKGKNNSILAYDDDGGDAPNSRITITLDPGTYTIEATSYYGEKTGNFTLSVTAP